MDTRNLSDRDLLVSILGKVEHIEEDVNGLKKGFSILKEKQDNVNDTLYGDKDRGIKGLVIRFKEINASILKYKKWEFGVALVVGFIGFVVSMLLALKELYNIFGK